MLALSLRARIVASLNASPRKSRPSTESGVRPAPFPSARAVPSVAVFMHFDQGVKMYELWRKPRPLLVAAMIVGLALVPSAFAGQPVIQTLTPAPPSFYACMAVGSGTICHGTISESSGPEETGLVCGSGADALNAWQTSSLVERAARYYDRDGNLTKRVLRDDLVGEFINPVTGTTVPWTQYEIHTSVLAVPGDIGSRTVTIVGEFVITVPHLGAVALEAGRVIEAVDGTDLFSAGPQDFTDYYSNGDTSAVAKLCGALGAT
jgi:hypothetical protein